MNCDFCGRDLSGDSTVKKAYAKQMFGDDREEKIFCDGPTLMEASRMGADVDAISLNPDKEERQIYANLRICAQAYKEAKAFEGYLVTVNVVQK